jgi:hypothetical protein
MKLRTYAARLATLLCAGLAVLTPSVDGQTNIVLPAPIPGTFQDFENVEEGELPSGWTATNHTDPNNFGPNLDDPKSDSYMDWVAISRTRMEMIGQSGAWDASRRLAVPPALMVNGAPITQLMAGKFIHAESDARSGNQIQILLSPNFDCTGQTGVTLAFHSAYEQNQDSMGVVEYSIDGGSTFLPAAYLIDRADIKRDGEGNVDAVATLTTLDPEAATFIDDLGNPTDGTFGSFIRAPIDGSLAPFIQGRINDNGIESKRVEVLRLAAADNKPSVKLRFVQAGTSSWYWGIDNIGLFSIPPQTPPARPVISAPSTVSFFSTGVSLTGSAFAGADGSQTHASSVWQISVAGTFQPETGFATPLVEVSSLSQLTSIQMSLERVFPGESVQATVRYLDQFGNRSLFAAPVTVAVSPDFPPLVPGTSEDFESTPESGIPEGWIRSHQSEDGNAFPDWFVVNEGTLGSFGGEVTNESRVFSGNSLYVESDSQPGNQIQFVTTKAFDCTGMEGVWLAYKSNYMQNQDSFGGVEYSTDGGQTFQPVVFMIDVSDFILNGSGQVDATLTLTTTYDDLARIFTDDDFTRVPLGKYEDFIFTRPIAGLAPFLSPRINDDDRESKRHQRYRLPGADNKASVQIRFTHAGTTSWHWGIDDFGLFATGSTPVASPLAITSVRAFRPGNVGAFSVELKWVSQAGKKYTVQSSTNLTQWADAAKDISATGAETIYTDSGFPETQSVRYYRVREQP